MPRFEVFVPAAPPKLPIDLTLRIDAEHWLAALKAGLQRIGEAQMANNVLCDIQADGAIHVTDPGSGRVFRILELQQPQPTAPAGRPPPPPPTLAPPPPAPRVVVPPDVPPVLARAPAPPPGPAAAPAATPARAPRRPSAQADRVEEARGPGAPPTTPIGRITRAARPARAEDVLAELFLEVAELEGIRDRRRGLEFLLDLAVRATDCESGSIFTADLGADELGFAAVRGPSAARIEALGLKVPMGVGLVGFCAQENVCVAVSDAQQDPRFYRAVSEAVGYETRSLLCAPAAHEGQVLGAVEVLNKRGGQPFGERDLAVVAYLAAQAARFLASLAPDPFAARRTT